MTVRGLRVFISHAAAEKALADRVAHMLDSVSLGAIETWRSTGPDGVAAGDLPWLRIHRELGASGRVLTLLTPYSCSRPG